MVIRVKENVYVQQSEIFLTLTPIILKNDTAFIADPSVTSQDIDEIKKLIHGKNVVRYTTHCHWDHIISSRDLNIRWEYTSPESRKIMDEKGPVLINELIEEMKQFNEDFSGFKSILLNETPLETERDLNVESIKFSAHYAQGHCPGQAFLYFPEERLLLSADTLSPSELPTFDSYNNLLVYLDDLNRLEEFILKSDSVFPGHGWPMEKLKALEILSEDRNYLMALKDYSDNPVTRKMDITAFINNGKSIPIKLREERTGGYSSSFNTDNLRAIYMTFK